jgi:hypothetical protein
MYAARRDEADGDRDQQVGDDECDQQGSLRGGGISVRAGV